ncbi:Uncharacterized protein TCAP_01747 [Tolypocladium capitatum]|uniref:F-box domain-containing protein n=1 Tax=Tolypocladium capitatum TaxID=45235 RepID=A0A2K3QLB4_9HYPO|nr:Uncharacterized protein TCAP_01747 [Tolypocladium capitatum]
MARYSPGLDKLPNEILAGVLAPLSARELIVITSVSRRFYSVAVRLLYRRLLATASLPDNELILECYHPSAKISTPYLCCRYLGTKLADGGAVDEQSPTLGDLLRLYSSFRPVLAEENRRRRFGPKPPPAAISWPEGRRGDEVAVQEVFLDEGELLTQLCAVTNVVKESSRPGCYVSHVNTCDGVVRIWRERLAALAGASTVREDEPGSSSAVDFGSFLWVDPGKSVGLRFCVRESPSERMPLISGPGDEAPVSYSLVYEELLVRTSMLLFAVEASAVREVARSSKAVVISHWTRQLSAGNRYGGA